jgi:hypothetical protein
MSQNNLRGPIGIVGAPGVSGTPGELFKVICVAMPEEVAYDTPESGRFNYNDYSIELGRIYDAQDSPIMYDPYTFQPIKYYIIQMDRGWMKVSPKFFSKLDEHRSKQLETIGI